MEEQFVSFETAMMAKKKGLSFLLKSGSNFDVYNTEDKKLLNYRVHFFYPDSSKYVFAPTQSLLQKWLREEHRLDILIETTWENEKMEKSNYSPWVYYRLEDKENPDDEIPTFYSTYESALEAALQEALNCIK